MKKLGFILLVLMSASLVAQGSLDYQQPPQVIKDLIDAPLAPTVRMNSQASQMVLLYRNAYKTIAELSEEELRLGGLRINPVTNINSRATYYNNIEVKGAFEINARKVSGLPAAPRMANFIWSPDESKMAFTNTATNGVEVWVLDIEKAQASRLVDARVNANLGDPISWMADGASLLVKILPNERGELIDTRTATPTGPTVTISSGAKAQNMTYQDLLKNPTDENNFEQLAMSEIHKVTLAGQRSMWMPADMYGGISLSPDGLFVLITKIKRPFSYIVPYNRFAFETTIYTAEGRLLMLLLDAPVEEVQPKGFMATTKEKRNFSWRTDKPATITWVKALDGGDPAVKVTHRDELFELDAPFTGKEKSLLKTINRFSFAQWGSDQVAIAHDSWRDNRNVKTYVFNPSNPKQMPKVLFDRSSEDQYGNPGRFVTVDNKFNLNVLALESGNAYLIGNGFSEKGQFPFFDQINLTNGKTTRLYQSDYTDKLESIMDGMTISKGELLVMIESPTEYPNYFQRNFKTKELKPMTAFANPFESMQDVFKEVINYKREDGVDLSGTLYLPVGYDKAKKEKMPMILWAYPREFKDKEAAGQNTTNPNRFIYPSSGSPIFWVTRGYVVLDGAAFPIVGEGEEEPNDTFRPQLVANAKAAIDAVDALGYIDRNRVGVGGHSYGAFMVANLLSHCDLFAAGIARSGAYNRTLTPFGFQGEERSYWEAQEVYNDMSPFMHADKMKTPMLIIHGEADNNTGTYPLQSERYFNALKGLGGPARLVMLPKESHSYSAIESIMHMLWEQDQWLEEHVKNRPTLEAKLDRDK